MEESIDSYSGGVAFNGARYAARVFFALLVAWLTIIIISAATSETLEFDGAMNLLMARSIADGNGPRAVYDTGNLFPVGVQTKEPFVLLGALIFKLFGVGLFRTQLPNLIYLAALCTILATALRRIFGTTSAIAGCAMLLASPWIVQYGLRGYGELPTLFFGLSALTLISWPCVWPVHTARRCLAAGFLAGLALATKVVGIVLVGVVGVVLLFRLFSDSSSRPQIRFGLAYYTLGVASPLGLVELWRWFCMGKSGYRAWWSDQFQAILSQSGASPYGPHVTLGEKIATHYQILCTQLGLGHLATASVLLTPLFSLAFAYYVASPEQRRRSKWFLLGMLLLLGLYFPWWLAIVPTDKAWLRYIYIGLISLEIIAAIGIVENFRNALSRPKSLVQVTGFVLALAVVGSYSPLMVKALRTPISFGPNDEAMLTMEAGGIISRLPQNATVLAYGWYAAPTVQMYTDRPFIDLTNWPIGRLMGKPAYVVADRPTFITGMLNRLLARYPHRELMPTNRLAQIYEVDFTHPNDPFVNEKHANTVSRVVFAEKSYDLTEGMEPFDPIGGRFIESDSEILLRYGGQTEFQLVGYMDAAQPSYYRWPGHLSGRIFIGDCPPLPFNFTTPGWRDFRMPLTCKPPLGTNVRIRIVLDNIFVIPYPHISQRAMLLNTIGFVDSKKPDSNEMAH